MLAPLPRVLNRYMCAEKAIKAAIPIRRLR